MLMMHKLKQDISNHLNHQDISDFNSQNIDEMVRNSLKL
jgi:hypothetical protein